KPKHRAAHLGVPVFQREIPMSRGGLREIRKLTLHPHDPEPPLEEHAHLAVQASDGENVAPGFRTGLDAGRHTNNPITSFTRARIHRTIAGFIHKAPVDSVLGSPPRSALNLQSAVMGGHANP